MTDKTDVENDAAEVVEDPVNNEDKKEGGVTVAGVHVSDHQLPTVGMFFAGLILLVALLVGGKDLKNWAYGISVASVAMFFSLIGFLLTFKEELNTKFGQFNSYFLFCWCFVGACILTFSGPYKVTGNGYFATWGLALFSIMGIGVTASALKKSITGMGALFGMGAVSIILIIAVSTEIRDDYYRNQGIYALIVAILSLVVVAALVYLEGKKGEGESSKSMVKFVVLAFFAINWIIAACIVTFQGPFRLTGNGYFAAWGGAVTSVFAAMAALKD